MLWIGRYSRTINLGQHLGLPGKPALCKNDAPCNLSDPGHLVKGTCDQWKLVRRRCRVVVASDYGKKDADLMVSTDAPFNRSRDLYPLPVLNDLAVFRVHFEDARVQPVFLDFINCSLAALNNMYGCKQARSSRNWTSAQRACVGLWIGKAVVLLNALVLTPVQMPRQPASVAPLRADKVDVPEHCGLQDAVQNLDLNNRQLVENPRLLFPGAPTQTELPNHITRDQP